MNPIGKLVLFRNIDGSASLGYVSDEMNSHPELYWVEWCDGYSEYYYADQIQTMENNVKDYINDPET